jgi:beta-glucosidase
MSGRKGKIGTGFAAALLAAWMVGGTCMQAQAVPAETANQARIEKLLASMTLEEKMNLIRGGLEPASVYQGQAGYLPGVPRLGVPSLRMADGPPGVLTRVAGQAETATMGVAATFSRADAEANGMVIGRDARSLGIDVILQPFINMDRDLEFARAYNTFGEDPFLTGQMGAAEIRGAQAQGVMAMAKHYIGYDSDSYSTVIDPQTLHEVYSERRRVVGDVLIQSPQRAFCLRQRQHASDAAEGRAWFHRLRHVGLGSSA